MNNFIEYFYGFKIPKISYKDNYCYFIYNNYTYILYTFYGNNEEIKQIYDLSQNFYKHTLIGEIIINKEHNIISSYNNSNYVLIKYFININKPITLEEISSLSNIFVKEKRNINWGILWSNKIDYLEELINENGKKYPLIVDSFNYFVGMCENAISYFNSIDLNNDVKYGISHKIINLYSSVETLYNPINIIYDYRVRDIAEYLKKAFFNNKPFIFNELLNYLNKNNLSTTEIKLLISRLLYPSFYFEMYEDIFINDKEETILINIVSKLKDYEKYLSKIISFFKKYYDIDEVLWIIQ